MKKFKTRNKRSYIKSFIILFILILFCFLSFLRLDKSYPKFISMITKKFKNDNISFISLTKNLDYLINSYAFEKEEKILNEKTMFQSYTSLMNNELTKLINKVDNSTENICELLYHIVGD